MQNSQKFKGQTNALARHLKRLGVEIVFVDAPYIIPDTTNQNPVRSWIEGNSIAESYEVIERAKLDNPDAVGLFGFSMGSMFALHLASHAAAFEDSPFTWIKIVFAAAAPFPSDPTAVLEPFESVSKIPVMFVIGETDAIAPPERQEMYLPYFPNNTVYRHPGGHYIPSQRALIEPILNFFREHEGIE